MKSAWRTSLMLLVFFHFLPLALGWFFESDHRCFFHCGRAASCGLGKFTTLHKFRRCENFLHAHRKVGLGPGVCRPPSWRGDRAFARKFFPARVCRQETACIRQALARKTRDETEKVMMDVLRVRGRGNALRNEMRLSRDAAYVRAVDKLTSSSTRAELLRFIASGGKVDFRSQFGNPIYRKVAAYLAANARMRRLLSRSRVRKARRIRDESRAKYLRRMKGHFDRVIGTKSKLRTKRKSDISNVRKWLGEIKKVARWMRVVQDEAVQVRFYRAEFREVRRDVARGQREVDEVKRKIAGKVVERSYHRDRLAEEKKRLVDTVRSLSKRVVAWQEKNCK